MSPLAVPIPGLHSSTPPTSRSGTPNRHSLKQYVSTVVPFTRPSGSGRLTPGPSIGSEEIAREIAREGSTSYTKEDFSRPSSGHSQRGDGSFFPESAGSWASLKRTTPRSASTVSSAPTVRLQGFSAPSPELQEAPPLRQGVGAPQGLLSRALSSECLAPRPQFPLESSPSREESVRKLYKSYAQPCAMESTEFEDVSSLGDDEDILERLQVTHGVFNSPCVVQAFKVARSARSALRAPANAPSELDSREHSTALENCCAVAGVLAELGADETMVAAALLHDVLQCSMMTETRLRDFVTAEVANIVSNVSRMSGICEIRRDMLDARGGTNDAKLAQDFTGMLIAMADVRAVLVKLADRLLNLRNTPMGSGREAAAHEALDIFAPLANRLGVWSIKAEMEDLAFQALWPKEHDELKAKLRESQACGSLEKALDSLKGLLDKEGPGYVDLSGRPKNLYGVFKKMQDKNRNVDEVLDVRALRVVVKSKVDCYQVLRQVHTLWKPVPDRTKDYIRRPKENNYQSLHTVVMGEDGVPMEVQIRTDKMHFIAEYGVAAHWRYKESLPSRHFEDQQVAWARWLITWKLELEDKKCRPRGSPAHDSSLADLANKICNFPEHAADCKFAAFLRSARFAPQDGSADCPADMPAQVILVDHSSGMQDAPLRIEQVPQQTTAHDFLLQLRASCAYPHELAMFVNHEQPVPDQVLMTGDKVEIARVAGPAPPDVVWTPIGKSAELLDTEELSGMMDPSRRSNLVRRPGRPPRPSSDQMRMSDAISAAELEAKREQLNRAFSYDIGQGPGDLDTIAVLPLSGRGLNAPLIFSYGFTEGQPEMAG